jgi:hypothetical protein
VKEEDDEIEELPATIEVFCKTNDSQEGLG